MEHFQLNLRNKVCRNTFTYISVIHFAFLHYAEPYQLSPHCVNIAGSETNWTETYNSRDHELRTDL